jgi:hypothetical protein
MVIQTRTSSIDRGACIKVFRQYPGEVCLRCDTFPRLWETDAGAVQVEYMWLAGSFLEPSRAAYTVEGGGGLLSVVPVCINANSRARTVEQLQTQKRDMHIAAFRYLLAETTRDLARIAEEQRVEDRLARDPSREGNLQDWLKIGGREEWLLLGMSDGALVAFTMNGLLVRIVAQCGVVLERHWHAALSPDRYTDARDTGRRRRHPAVVH